MFQLLGFQLWLAVVIPKLTFSVEFYAHTPTPNTAFLPSVLCFPAGQCLASQNEGRSKEKASLSE